MVCTVSIYTEGSSCAKYPFCRGHNLVGWAGWSSGLPVQSTENGNEHLAKAVEASSNTSPSGQYLSKICKKFKIQVYISKQSWKLVQYETTNLRCTWISLKSKVVTLITKVV